MAAENNTATLQASKEAAELGRLQTSEGGKRFVRQPATGGAAMRPWADCLGLVASIGCAIHCAAMPFMIAFLPLLGLSFLADSSFHRVMVVVCTLLAIAAFVPGWRRHGSVAPVAVAVVGLAIITFAAFVIEDSCCAHCVGPTTQACAESSCDSCGLSPEQISHAGLPEIEAAPSQRAQFALMGWLTPLGGLLLVTAHLANHRLVCRCGCCPGERKP